MKVTSQILSSTSLIPRRCPARTLELLVFLRGTGGDEDAAVVRPVPAASKSTAMCLIPPPHARHGSRRNNGSLPDRSDRLRGRSGTGQARPARGSLSSDRQDRAITAGGVTLTNTRHCFGGGRRKRALWPSAECGVGGPTA